ncbi:MAG: hypothetical protein IJA12_02810 [Oscillospiraceae bacterium]|nr:hypothetical protein [Oscillospiraceae bacterium]
MNYKNNKLPLTLWFILSFIPLLAVTILSIYYAVKGRLHYGMIEPYTYMLYGFDEFCHSFFYYGFYCIPVFDICFFYQIYYIVNKIKLKRKVS